MKKLLLTAAAAFSIGAVQAQLPNGSLAPNWTLKDLNGNVHTLYDYLDQGKTVIIDVSAAWCGPCWSYHNTHALRDLYQQHGPTGMSGVNANTTNDVMVFFIEGEAQNTRAQLYGTSGTGALTSQGDWVTGTPYPIIDTPGATQTAFNTAWNIGYFPTVYMICRDRLVYEVGQLTAANLYTATQQGCPTYAPSTSVDAKAVPYSGKDYFVCSATPQVKFQNYSQSNSITSATINIKSGNTTVATQNWTGNLAPYGVATVNINSFTPTQTGPFKFEVIVNNDSYTANNISEDSIFRVLNASSAASIPYTETFNALTRLPMSYGEVTTTGGFFFSAGSQTTPLVGADGQSGKAIGINFYNLQSGQVSELVAGNYNAQPAGNLWLEFDMAYRQYSPTSPENDKLEVLVSTDCGVNWTSVWSKAGNTLRTTTPDSTAGFIPTSANVWRRESVALNNYKNSNLLVKFKMTSDYGNYGWIDNIKLFSNVTSVNEVESVSNLSIYPNPAKDFATISYELKSTSNVQIQVLDAAGRVVATPVNGTYNAGAQQFQISTENMAAGLYNVKIQTETGSRVERLTVVK